MKSDRELIRKIANPRSHCRSDPTLAGLHPQESGPTRSFDINATISKRYQGNWVNWVHRWVTSSPLLRRGPRRRGAKDAGLPTTNHAWFMVMVHVGHDPRPPASKVTIIDRYSPKMKPEGTSSHTNSSATSKSFRLSTPSANLP